MSLHITIYYTSPDVLDSVYTNVTSAYLILFKAFLKHCIFIIYMTISYYVKLKSKKWCMVCLSLDYRKITIIIFYIKINYSIIKTIVFNC